MIKIIFVIIILLTVAVNSIKQSQEVRLYPNTENSPSIYMLPFKLNTALPSKSYILVTMDWYSTALIPFNCILVNTTIKLNCTNLNSPTFGLTITTAHINKFNSKMQSASLKTKTIAILVNSNLLADTSYFLQLHLTNVIPNIKKISPNIEIYTVSYDGLVYQYNPNFAAVINNVPNTNLMAVSILNDLSATQPGSSSTMRAQITISKAISTSLSSLMIIVHNPFSFSVGSIPSTFQSSIYTTSPIALNSKPTIASYQIVSPNIFTIVFNEKFLVNRKFILQISQIINPFAIASSNISIYSLNYNTHTPLEAFQMLYPIATNSYSLSMVLGLPHNAPFVGPMKFYYQRTQNMAQIKLTIPYAVPDGYSIRIVPNLASFNIYGHAYCNLQSNTYTPLYSYPSTAAIIVSKFGPLAVGTVVICNFHLYINTLALFRVAAYIDTQNVINTFTATKYLYFSQSQDSAITRTGFYSNFYSIETQRIAIYDTMNSGVQYVFQVYQGIGATATSTGSYLDVYILNPYIEVNPSFNTNNDARVSIDNVLGFSFSTITVTYEKTSTYLRLTIKFNSASLTTYGNLFPFNSNTYFRIKNLFYFPYASTNKMVYPVYWAMYKSDIVNPTIYYDMSMITANSPTTLPATNLNYINNYQTSDTTKYLTYPGVLRFQSTTPSLSLQNIVVQPNQPLGLIISARPGFRSITTLKNMDPYPCASNIPVRCTYLIGWIDAGMIINLMDRIMVQFLDQSYRTKPFHIIFPDTNTGYTKTFYYQLGFYNQLTKDWIFKYTGVFHRDNVWWISSTAQLAAKLKTDLTADITGKAGSYRNNVRITVSNPDADVGQHFMILSTQWSFFEMTKSTLSPSTLNMLTPARFFSDNLSPLSLYMTNGMYLTFIPIKYVVTNTLFNITLDNVHMPYTYDLPNFYLYIAKDGDFLMASSNSFLMTNGGTLYSGPLQNLLITCQDNAKGVVNTYCNIAFGTSNPLLAGGVIRVAFSGMTVSTDLCYLTLSNGTKFKVPCSSSSDNLNVTVTMTGWQFYPTGNNTLTVYGIGLTSSALSQSIQLFLYDSSIQFIIERGVRILTTTIADLYSISLTQINYAYLNPLSYNTMTIKFYLPRLLYEDEEFGFVIGEDLSDVNTQPSRLNIIIKRSDNFIVKALYSLDSVNYLILFSFIDLTELTIGDYTMIIYGILTPASQANGAFNMIYRRKKDFEYTVVNSANVIFPTFNSLVTSDITMLSYYNTEGFKQDIEFTITNTNLNIDENVVIIINFPTYYSSHLFQQDAYCMIDQSPITCILDQNVPYQLIIKNSPRKVNYGTQYKITVFGLSCPKSIYMGNTYQNRFIFVGVLATSSSSSFSQRGLILPHQTVQSSAAGIINIVDMINSSPTNYAFSSIYAQLSLICSVSLTEGSYLYLDFPIEFDNLNNVPLNVILQYGSSFVSISANVKNRRVQILLTINITLQTTFILQFPSLPTPKSPGTLQMSHTIITVSNSLRQAILAGSQVQGNSAPKLTFISNARYISFNNDQTLTITAGTYSNFIDIDSSDNNKFISNLNIKLSSSGLVFEPETVFIAIGQLKSSFRVGASQELIPITYFYQGVKQQQLFSNYQVSQNMNIRITNNPVPIVLPTTLTMPLGGCTIPTIIKLTNLPFSDVIITYTFDNIAYSEDHFYPNSLTTQNQLTFTNILDNNTFSFCSSTSLTATQIPISLHLFGTNANSYTFSPSNVILVNIVPSISNTTPTVTLSLKNQQKTFLDIDFTNNVDGNIYYQMMIGQNQSPLTLQEIMVSIKQNIWSIQKQSDLLIKLYTTDLDNRLGSFYQVASQTTVRINNLIPQSFYTLCAYIVNGYMVSSQVTCIQLSTLTWGTIMKARLSFTSSLNTQQLNNVLCYFTSATATNQYYLADIEGNSCGNRSVVNKFYKYSGTSFTTETTGTLIYLVNNPYIIGTDPSPLAFTNLFGTGNALTVTSLSTAQAQFSITYLSGTYISSTNARLSSSTTIPQGLSVFFNTPVYDSTTKILTVSNVQILGNVGTVYFVLVLYKQVSTISGKTFVNIRQNKSPSVEQVLNCQNWQGIAAHGCARAVYSGVSALTVTFSNLQASSLYMLYYLPASQYPFRPIVSGNVLSQTIVTYSFQKMNLLISILLISFFIVVL